MEHIINPKAINSNPASILSSLLLLNTAMSRFDTVRAILAGSCLSTDGEVGHF
jgi:hypothetical protein